MEFQYEVITSGEDLEKALAFLGAQDVIGLDTETTGLDPYKSRIRLVQLGSRDRSFIIDLFQTPSFGDALKPLFTAPRPLKVIHNAKFDLKMISRHLGVMVEPVFDTMLASQLVGAGREGESHSLANASRRFLGLEIDKTQQSSDWSGALSETQLRYAAYDAILAMALYDALSLKLQELELKETAALEFGTVASIASMELAGILLDAAKWITLVDSVDLKHKEVALKLQQALEPGAIQPRLFGDAEINLDSPAQVMEALHRMGIPVEGTRGPQLHQFAEKHPAVELLLEYRSLQKSLSSYGAGMIKFIHPVTGRIHADFRQIGTPTGRLSCHEPNIQQIPHSEEYRSCFIAPPGRKLIIADYSQIELRILADWAEDEVLIEALCGGYDLHRTTASLMFGLSIEDVTPQHRSAAKSLNYGIVYGMGAPGLAARIGSSVHDAEQLIARYFATYRGVAAWLRASGERAVAECRSRTRLGRLMVYDFDPADHSAVSAVVRLGKNSPIQGTSADITKRAMMLLHRSLENSSSRLVNSIHDELVIEADASEADAAAEILKRQMVAAGAEFIHQVPVTVDLKIADAWLKN